MTITPEDAEIQERTRLRIARWVRAENARRVYQMKGRPISPTTLTEFVERSAKDAREEYGDAEF